MSDKELDKAALAYHRQHPPGKIAVVATKPMSNRYDLSLAYSPGVAAACQEIKRDSSESFALTSRGNTVAVISNGTSVLGLGNIGALASKPVMEGKAVLFKRFAGINGIDIEVDETGVDKFCDIVSALEPSFGGINLEDIKAPECFEIEKRLSEQMNIPVFHDDQHGTAIIASAGLINALELIDKRIEEIKVVCNGAGSAGIAILNMFCVLGAKRENILLCDSKGVVHSGRKSLNEYKEQYAIHTDKRTLEDALVGSDVFIGVSVANAVTPKMLKSMSRDPVVFALANPTPEILPEVAYETRADVIVATGRSDYPNQINNVLCFPFLFRGALDVGATKINNEMKIACAQAIASLAKKEADESATQAYSEESLLFSRKNIIPKPFDGRLIEEISPAVANMAIRTGVATRPLDSMYAYRNTLRRFVNRSSMVIQNVFKATNSGKDLPHVVFSDGEDQRVLNAAQMLINDRVAKPVLVGRRRVVKVYMERYALRFDLDNDVIIVDPESDPRYREYYEAFHQRCARSGITPETAKTLLRTDTTVIAAMLLEMENYDSMICGLTGTSSLTLKYVTEIVGLYPGVSAPVGVNIVMPHDEPIFIADTRVSVNPEIERLVEIADLSSQVVRIFNFEPKIAMIAHSSFGSSDSSSCVRMRQATRLLKERYPEMQIEGEMTPDAAFDAKMRKYLLPNNDLSGSANLLIMPNLDTANVAYRMPSAVISDGFSIGPIFQGFKRPVSIVNKVSTSRMLYNISCISVRQSQFKGFSGSSKK